MKLFLRIAVTFILMVSGVTAMGYYFWYRSKFIDSGKDHSISVKKTKLNNLTMLRLKQKAALLYPYAVNNDYNASRCFMVDMKIASGEKRFFVYNLQKDSVETAGLVTHGSGSDKGTEELFFSNRPNSNCTSLGRYKVGRPYTGKFGLAYKLYGLDTSNNKAFERFVVLHSHPCVPADEVAPLPICESWGCPTVAPSFLTELKSIVDRSEKPILLWIYY
jgi:hypothetical protein